MDKMKKVALLVLIQFGLVLALTAQDNNDIRLANEYYLKGEVNKALELYSELAKNPRNITLIHNNYFSLLVKNESYQQATKYINKLVKRYPDNQFYQVDKGILLLAKADSAGANKQFDKLIASLATDQYGLKSIAQYFVIQQLPEYAIKAFKEGRKAFGSPTLFAMEIANVYQVLDKKDQMLEEYLNFVETNPRNLNYIKNILQTLLTDDEDLDNLEAVLYRRIQEQPDNNIYSELIIWVNLQRKNFKGAFYQARALDKREKTDGNRVFEIGIIALQNNAYDNAVEIFNYLIKEYPQGVHYMSAKRYTIQAREQKIKNIFPVDTSEIRTLTLDYQDLIDEIGINHYSLEALRNKALLHAFYLDEKEVAVNHLSTLIDNSRSDRRLKSQAKLDLGDIYILTGEPWESTLLYTQVEKTNKESPMGYMAKLKNAKLHYYKGDFSLAQSHLDILKEATDREISNDAISLSLLIKNNTILDTTDQAMQSYAFIELLLFQNKKNEAKAALHTMLEKYKGHSLTDEIYWLLATLHKEVGSFQEAIDRLQAIVDEYPTDILSDDAYYTIGTIYENYLDDKDKAMEVYQNLLVQYPGSVFTSEARKRFRSLRGDQLN